ncbi:MAG: Lrp/AsnC family transcriptional regulator [Gammaproteobacteria bacterium]|nr:MAG: Lrp/AsnC family transcriptional regulator [Gammaproteobacteria bacterium]
MSRIDPIDRRLIEATQGGLPLVPRPWEVLAGELGLEPAEVLRRVRSLHSRGVIRRVAAVPNHYALGYRANAMTVWDLPDERVAEVGERLGALEFVSHCYQRPRRLPEWRYNLFVMVHGRDRQETERQIGQLKELIGGDARAFDVLYSSRILKKTGLRLADPGRPE